MKEDSRVGIYYFYIVDPEFGPGFIKLCTYAPWPGKVWLNGHEWVKRQVRREEIAFTALHNGFASCEQPERLQALCDTLGPGDVQAFFDRWIAVIPTPLSASDRAGGFWWELSMRQVEVSRTLVFDDRRRARSFFEALVADNIAIGRPEEVSLVFARQVRKTTGSRSGPASSPPAPTCGSTFATSSRASSNTSKTGARCASRPSSTNPRTSTSQLVFTTCLS